MLIRRCQAASEAILIGMACLAPWIFGAVEAWAEFLLFLGIFLLAILSLVIRVATDRSRALFCLPSVAIGGLVLLAALQATPLAPPLLKRITPAAVALRTDLAPVTPERVSGDSGTPVSLPAPTISLDPEATTRATIRLMAGWVLFQAVLGLGLGTASLRRFGIAMAGNAMLVALFSLIQMLSWNGRIYWIRESPSGSSGPFVNHDHLAAYLNLGLGFAFSFLLAPRREARIGERQNGGQLWAGYATGLIIVGIVASLARTGFVAMLVSIGVVLVLLRPQAKKLVLALSAIGMLIILFLAAVGASIGYQERIASLLDSEHYLARLQIWKTALQLVPAYPIWGTGFGSFGLAVNRNIVGLGQSVYEHAENETIEWLLEGGLLGIGLVLTTVGGTIALGRRALRATPNRSESALICGAFFGISSLLIQSLAGFALHVPAVAIVAVIVAAQLAKLGLEAGPSGEPATASSRPLNPGRRVLSALGAIAMIAASAYVLVPGVQWMQVETAMADAGMFLQGATKRATGEGDETMDELERKQDLLERVVRIRPNWAEGHWRLGLIFLRLYSTSAMETLADELQETEQKPETQTPQSTQEQEQRKEQLTTESSPIWLFSTVHSAPEDKRLTTDELLDIDHIRLYLIPAARCFLEARRCSPLMADPHGRLGLLDYLLQGGDPPQVYAARALRLAGSNLQVLELVQSLALHLGDLDLIARSWKKILSLEPSTSQAIAVMAKEIFPAQMICDRIIPSGSVALLFAEQIYQDPAARASRELLLRMAIAKLPSETNLKPIDRYQFEGRAWFLLNDREQARLGIEKALALDPQLRSCRVQLVDWLIGWGQAREAYDQAMIGLYYSPNDPLIQQARDRAADALAKTER